MRARATNPNNSHANSYSQRGIGCCVEWESFENFLRDMGECPEGMTLERKNNDEGYSPDNCRWATSYEQARNTSRTIKVTRQGLSYVLSDLNDHLGFPRGTLWRRTRNLGWSLERACLTPIWGGKLS